MGTQRHEAKLKRSLGFNDLMAIAIGQIIGAGIMTSTGVAIGMTGTGVVLAYLICPILTLICIYPVALLTAAVPTTGGSYRYVTRLLGKTTGTVYLWLSVISCVGVSHFALGIGMYFVNLVPGAKKHIVAFVAFTIFYIINMFGAKSAALLNKIMSIALIGGLLLFIAFGIGKVDFGYVFNTKNLFRNGGFGFMSTLGLLGFATSGAQQLVQLGGEAKNPKENIPKVMIISTLGVGVIYVLMGLVASGVLPIEEVANQTLTLVAQKTMPSVIFYLFVIGAALGATATTLNATLLWITKPLLVACDDGLLPRSFGSVNKYGVPWKLLTIVYIIGSLPLLLGFQIAFIAKFSAVNSLLMKLFPCIALFALAVKRGDLLKTATISTTVTKAKIYSLAGAIVITVLSGSLLLSISYQAIIFLAVLIVLAIIYVKTLGKKLKIEDDLTVDYTSKNK